MWHLLLLVCCAAVPLLLTKKECKEKNGPASDSTTCRACVNHQYFIQCAYNPQTGACRQAKKELTWIKTKTGCNGIGNTVVASNSHEKTVTPTNEDCKQPCLKEITSGYNLNDVQIHPDLIYDNPTVLVTEMYRDKDNKMCHSAVGNPLTLVASVNNDQDWPLMDATFDGDAGGERRKDKYYVKGAIALRHDTRSPDAVFAIGFTSGNVDSNHPNADSCSSHPKWTHESFSKHQINNHPETYCNLISTTNCLGIGFYVSYTYAVVVPEGYDYVHKIHDSGGKEGNSEIMAIGTIPSSYIYAARASTPDRELDINPTKINALWNDDGYNQQRAKFVKPAPKIIFNPNFDVALTDAEEEALLAMLHVTCERDGEEPPSVCR